MNNLAFASTVALAEKIRRKEMSAVELLEFYFHRVETYNPALNAIIFVQRERARQRAQAADTALARGESWGPLHGVPMTIKESFDWIGSPSTWGHPAFKENYPQRDALAVERLQNAGAVVFGKTNVPLLLADCQSFNDIYGTSNNPWDVTRVPGGSSGGAAAALAAGLTGLELGSDMGGSIRIPAHYCGVFGHKPTYGIVPWEGHALSGVFTPTDIAVHGPLARSAADLSVALDVLTSAHKAESDGWRLKLPAARKSALNEYKVAVMLTSPYCTQDHELTDQLQRTIDTLVRCGVHVDDKARPAVDFARSHHVYWMLVHAVLGMGVPEEKVLRHRARAATRAAEDRSPRAYMDRSVALYYREWWYLHNEREQMRLAWADFFQEYDLFLCPAAASVAFPHAPEGSLLDRTVLINGREERAADQLFWAGLSGVVHLPSTVTPVGLTRSGLPSGMQIVGAYMQDHTCIEFAHLVERELGGFMPPPGYD